MPQNIILYHYWRSSCSWRVRWALDLKGVKHKAVAVDLLKGEQKSPAFLAKNPSGFVPVLDVDGQLLGESLAILEWLEENYPQAPLLPADSYSRAIVRQLCLTVVAGIQPLQNLKTQHYVSTDAGVRSDFARHWNTEGLKTYETMIAKTAGSFSFGGQLTMADICLIPQVYNARRYAVDVSAFPTIERIYQRCLQQPACLAASPDQQPGAKP